MSGCPVSETQQAARQPTENTQNDQESKPPMSPRTALTPKQTRDRRINDTLDRLRARYHKARSLEHRLALLSEMETLRIERSRLWEAPRTFPTTLPHTTEAPASHIANSGI